MSPDSTAATPATQATGGAALAGIRVLDFTQYESGTSCTQALAFMGAEVIKIEPPGKGDPGRRSGASKDNPADAYYFLFLNHNKNSVTLNLKHEKSRAILNDLIAKCDVFVENFGPGVIERLGLDYASVSKINPRIIYAQIKGFSPDGPYRSFLAFDSIVQAAGGAMSINGEANSLPLKPGMTVADYGTGLHCLSGILAALYRRQASGRGQRIEVAMQEVMLNFTRNAYAAQMETGKVQTRGGGGVAASKALRGLFKCKGDGPNDYVFITSAPTADHHFQRLMKVMGREELITDPRFIDNAARVANAKDIRDLVAAWALQRDKKEVMKLVGDAGTPVGAVYDTKDLSGDAHLLERGAFLQPKHPVRGQYTAPAWPVRMSANQVDVRPAPLLGADTEKVLTGLLGLKPEDVKKLRDEQAI